MIKDWEEHDQAKDQEVHQYRLQNIALRNRLANQEKVLRRREQLADGLHLIDYEQLKIENQTLNEKIEERNEDLHKLRHKITRTVIILSHNREKYQFIMKKNEKQELSLDDKTNELTDVKNKLSELKKKREKLQKQNQKLKQKTGIVSQTSLKKDFERRTEELKVVEADIVALKERHAMLLSIIQEAKNIEAQA